jgi:hypothetical protein
MAAPHAMLAQSMQHALLAAQSKGMTEQETALPTYTELVSEYRNTASHNDAVYDLMTRATLASPLLASHRKHVVDNRLGFGDTAFHALWNVLLREAVRAFGAIRALEIGVYKGQIISLWKLIAAAEGLAVDVSAISPLRGNAPPSFALFRRVRRALDRRFREQLDNGNFYPEDDYERAIRELFAHFDIRFDEVNLYRGLSTDPAVLSAQQDLRYHLVYVDGDHTYDGASKDFRTFGDKIVPGGWLVADDAGCMLPGTRFWKGHQAVSRAAELLPALGFVNVFNIGHNRVFQKA